MSVTPEPAAANRVPPMPAKVVGGYLETWIRTQPSDVPAAYNVLFSAFATIGADGTAEYAPSQDPGRLRAAVVARAAVGQPTLLSVGGAGGSRSGLHTRSEQAAFLASARAVIDGYGFTGIDWDIEAETPTSVAGMAAVSRSLVAAYGPDFAITMAPYGQTEAVYQELVRSIRDIVTFVGFQFYNDTAPPTPASVLARMERWLAATRISPAQFALGFMPTDDAGAVTSYPSMVSIYEAVNARYPTVRGVYTWAVGSDERAGFAFVKTLEPAVRSSPAARSSEGRARWWSTLRGHRRDGRG